MAELYFEDSMTRLNRGDARHMVELPDESVQCVVTSPPYWGLREYKGEQELIWGGRQDCPHEWSTPIITTKRGHAGPRDSGNSDEKVRRAQPVNAWQNSQCHLCGAWRGAYGLEPTVQMYVEHSLEFMREIRRVLRGDGLLYWNIGDSYASVGKWGGSTSGKHSAGLHGDTGVGRGRREYGCGLKAKDLCLIPFRVALAAQLDGWYVRADVIWDKVNVMPESVTDRPTRSHEHVLMLSKSARYYYDQEAVRETLQQSSIERAKNAWHGQQDDDAIHSQPDHTEVMGERWAPSKGRNLRSVWRFSTRPFRGRQRHFATFPEELPQKCILAATPEAGSCAACGRPWKRIVKKPDTKGRPTRSAQSKQEGTDEIHVNNNWAGYPKSAGQAYQDWRDSNPDVTVGWKPQCKCDAGDPAPAVVLDPFAGTGTTLWVAKKLGRAAVGYDISEAYCRLAVERNRQSALTLRGSPNGGAV